MDEELRHVEELLETGYDLEEPEWFTERQRPAEIENDAGMLLRFSATWRRNDGVGGGSGMPGESDTAPPPPIMYKRSEVGGENRDILLSVDDGGRVSRPYLERTNISAVKRVAYAGKAATGLRSLVLMLDNSESVSLSDLKPSHTSGMGYMCERLVRDFFEFCPVGMMSIVLLQDEDATILSPLSGSVNDLKHVLDEYGSKSIPSGSAAVQAGLERAYRLLNEARPYATKEILIVWSSCYTNDSGDIEKTIELLAKEKIIVNIISLTPELFVFKKLTERTGGDYVVCLDRHMVQEALLSHSEPRERVVLADNENSTGLILMGFPEKETSATATMCLCHNMLTFSGYNCPRCHVRNCSLPTACKACQLPLVSSVDIARSAPPQFVVPFTPVSGVRPDCFQSGGPQTIKVDTVEGAPKCFACTRVVLSGGATCPRCNQHFCL